jgi:hypothetical protein
MPNRQLTLARKIAAFAEFAAPQVSAARRAHRMMRFRGAIHGLLIWFIDTSLDRRAGAQQGRAQ